MTTINTSIADQIVSVQPMTAPTGYIFYLDYHYHITDFFCFNCGSRTDSYFHINLFDSEILNEENKHKYVKLCTKCSYSLSENKLKYGKIPYFKKLYYRKK